MNEAARARSAERAPWPVFVVVAILLLEALALIGITVWLVIEAFGETGMHIVGTLFLAAMAIGSAVWLGLTARRLLQGRRWTRAATLVWQVLQIAIGAGSVTGEVPRPDIAAILVIPAIIAGVLVLGKRVSAWYDHNDPAT